MTELTTDYRPTPEQVRRLAALRGMATTVTAPMSNAARAEVYRRQRGGASAVAPVLTARQRRRLRKRRVRTQAMDLVKAVKAGATYEVKGSIMTGPEYDRMLAAQRELYARGGAR